MLSQGSSNTKILGFEWIKETDKLSVVTPGLRVNRTTKRNILSELAPVYDPTGLISLSHLTCKILYREFCDLKTPWGETVKQE